MDTTTATTLIVIAVIVVVALLFLLLVRSRKQRVTFSDQAPFARPAAPRPAAEPASERVTEEGHGVGSEVAAAIEDVVDQFIGINAHSSGEPATTGPGDTLTRLKGLGPKAAARLADLGVTRFDQIASWNEADISAIDEQMGAFKGRIRRDRWVEQARLLAGGDTTTFEAEFGKLGS
jgi:predicted flap endonuclease-1-like 5' DNA nuclease